MGAETEFTEKTPLMSKIRAVRNAPMKKMRPGYHIFPLFTSNKGKDAPQSEFVEVLEGASRLSKEISTSHNVTMNFLTLEFSDKDVDDAYSFDYANRGLGPIRIHLVLGCIMFVCIAVYEGLTTEDTSNPVLESGFGVSAPAFAVAFLFTFLEDFLRNMQSCMVYTLLFSSFGRIYATIMASGSFFPSTFLYIIFFTTVSRIRFFYCLVSCLTIIITFYISEILYSLRSSVEETEELIFVILSSVILLSACYSTEISNRKDFLMALALFRTQRQAQVILEAILPKSIITRVRNKTQAGVVADRFTDVTILFADIVGFTVLSSRCSAAEVVGLLNRMFCDFDQAALNHGLEKIKTIGDCYMVAGGLPEPSADHPERMALFSVDMRDIVQRYKKSEGIDVRIGINTGETIAGVIGSTKFLYDVWGDAVNVASRMESHGVPSKIHISEATYLRLKDNDLFTFEARGEMNIKGKGLMKTYLLERNYPDFAKVREDASSVATN